MDVEQNLAVRVSGARPRNQISQVSLVRCRGIVHEGAPVSVGTVRGEARRCSKVGVGDGSNDIVDAVPVEEVPVRLRGKRPVEKVAAG